MLVKSILLLPMGSSRAPHLSSDVWTMQCPPGKLLDQVRDAMRLKHYSLSTEKAYVAWIKRLILDHNKRHPLDVGTTKIKLSMLLCSCCQTTIRLAHR